MQHHKGGGLKKEEMQSEDEACKEGGCMKENSLHRYSQAVLSIEPHNIKEKKVFNFYCT